MKRKKLISVLIAAAMMFCLLGNTFEPVLQDMLVSFAEANRFEKTLDDGVVLGYYKDKDYVAITYVDPNGNDEVIIPDNIDGLPVRYIYEHSFSYNFFDVSGKNINLPDSLKGIGSFAFQECLW